MIVVVLDSNAVHRDLWLMSGAGPALLTLASAGHCEVVYPVVVLQELRRQQREELLVTRGEADAVVDRAARLGASMHLPASQLREAFDRLAEQIDANFDDLLSRPGVALAPVPGIALERLVARDLERRRPFHAVGTDHASAGFRDAVIWESLLSRAAASRAEDTVIFVTADTGFLAEDGKGFHPDLVEDVLRLPGEHATVQLAKNVWAAKQQVDALVAATEQAEREAALATAATNALLSLVGESVSLQMVYGGDYDYPEFVQFSAPGLEDATISDIEQQSEFELVTSGDLVIATAEATVYFEGFVAKSDWFMDEGSGVELLEDWNDHYFHAQDEAAVRVMIKLSVEEGVTEVTDIKLLDPLEQYQQEKSSGAGDSLGSS